MSIKLSSLVLALLPAASQSTTSAQTSSYYGGTQTNGMFGSNTLGGTSGTSSGQSLSGSGGNSNVATGNSNVATGQTNVAMSNQNIAQSVIANTRQQTQGAFVGADTADTGNFLSRQSTTGTNGAAGRNGGMNGLSQLQSLFSQNQQGFNGGQNQTPVDAANSHCTAARFPTAANFDDADAGVSDPPYQVAGDAVCGFAGCGDGGPNRGAAG